jgi:hypothetical protein
MIYKKICLVDIEPTILAGKADSSHRWGRLLATVLSSTVGLVEIQSREAGRGSVIGLKLFGIIPESRSRFSGIPISVQNSTKQGATTMSEISTLVGYAGRTINRDELSLVPTPPGDPSACTAP